MAFAKRLGLAGQKIIESRFTATAILAETLGRRGALTIAPPTRKHCMYISVIICTIRRKALIRRLLDSLEVQDYRNFEVLIVRPEEQADEEKPFGTEENYCFPIKGLAAPKGLSAARNVALREAKGDLLCFLDDDVVLEPNFLSTAMQVFLQPEMQDVGGVTGYDTRNYPAPVAWRWRCRMLLRMAPSLQPGDSNHLGRSVPLSFSEPFSGCREVKWLVGFCQIFRRAAVENLLYDEMAVAEDRDFSLEVGRRWRLVICGDLRLAHYRDTESRSSYPTQAKRAAFALGRSFAKRKASQRDWLFIIWTFLGEMIIDLAAIARRPSLDNFRTLMWRASSFIRGFASVRPQSA